MAAEFRLEPAGGVVFLKGEVDEAILALATLLEEGGALGDVAQEVAQGGGFLVGVGAGDFGAEPFLQLGVGGEDFAVVF